MTAATPGTPPETRRRRRRRTEVTRLLRGMPTLRGVTVLILLALLAGILLGILAWWSLP